MIVEYWRPSTVSDALALLARKDIITVPLGGGTKIHRNICDDVAVVDLQQLGLDKITVDSKNLMIGSGVRMQALMESPVIPEPLQRAAGLVGGLNYRNQATAAGEIIAGDGRSALLTGLLAMNASLLWALDRKEVGLGEFLALRKTWPAGGLILQITIPTNVTLSLESVSRTPKDQPILIAAVCKWPSGRIRVALGGHGEAPILAMDGQQAGGAGQAAYNAYLHASDAWASADYRSQVAQVLVRQLSGENLEAK